MYLVYPFEIVFQAFMSFLFYNRTMYAYEIWVKSTKYHGKSPLTYTSLTKLQPGYVVKVDLKRTSVLGIVRRETSAPKGVAMKPIDSVLSSSDTCLPSEQLQLLNWLLQYYPVGSGYLTSLFLPSFWPKINSQTSGLAAEADPKLPKLKPEQIRALASINSHPGTTLLHGDTGSGKTRIYIELIKAARKEGRSSLVLVPEIGLTPHLQKQLMSALPSITIKVFHSNLTPAKRGQIWLDIASSNKPIVVIGPRSALFVPLNNIGLIVVDECHDDGYKQSNAPHYHALRVASKLAELHNANLIFGSATPAISDVYTAKQKKIPITRLTELATGQKKRNVKTIIVNKRDKSQFTKSRNLSNDLIGAIDWQIKNGQQSLLFLNRRGSARVVACSDCGWQAVCPNCDLPLTLHEDLFSLRCHTCGYTTSPPTSCPTCGNAEIIYYGPGTKAIQKDAQKLFPGARIERFDSDNLTNDRLDKNFEAIEDGSIDILIGTQILIKGFDILNLGLVGIIDADASLTFPDFSTEERTYQLINQAVGRVGRGHVPGSVIAQTLRPDNPLLAQALKADWNSYYETQLSNRAEHVFPPFTFLIKLTCERKSRASSEKASNKLKETLLASGNSITVLGPTPSFKEKHRGNYSWQLVVKSPRRSILLDIISRLPSGWKYDIDPTHLL